MRISTLQSVKRIDTVTVADYDLFVDVSSSETDRYFVVEHDYAFGEDAWRVRESDESGETVSVKGVDSKNSGILFAVSEFSGV